MEARWGLGAVAAVQVAARAGMWRGRGRHRRGAAASAERERRRRQDSLIDYIPVIFIISTKLGLQTTYKKFL